MKAIWKYTLTKEGEQTVIMPKGSIPLSVGVCGEELSLFMLVETDWPRENRKVFVATTEAAMTFDPDQERFVGTAILSPPLRGTIVKAWHVWISEICD